MSLHAHITRRSRDCDGEYRSGHTATLTHEERASEFSDLEFKHRVIISVVSVHALLGTLEVTEERVTWHETTDEGYTSSTVEWCEDECPDGKGWQRDLSAEAAGY